MAQYSRSKGLRLFLFANLAFFPALGSQMAFSNPYESESPATAESKIDELVFGRLKRLGIEPAAFCSDAVFVRRAFLDVIGTLPTRQEAAAFIQSEDQNKRGALIEQLLERPEFADYWAMRWGDLLRVRAEFPINLWPNAAQAYHRWIRDSIRDNLPYDRFAREMLTGNGSNFRVGQVNFYRAAQNKTPEGIAGVAALTFMGMRTRNWPEEKLAGMAAFFTRISYKPTGEWKEEVVYFDPRRTGEEGAPIGPQSTDAVAEIGAKAAARATAPEPVKAIFPDGTAVTIPATQDPRQVFADWLITEENPWFARAISNRVWSWFLGRGIVHEPDDFRSDNPPVNPELLAYLEKELLSARYDLKHLFRLILNSRTYQLSSTPKTETSEARANFASYPMRRLEAEVLIDALNQITGTTEKYSSAVPEPFTYVPEDQRAIGLPDASITSSFLQMFGRPSRDTGLEMERSNVTTAGQRLHLLNSSHIQRKIQNGPALRGLLKTVGVEVKSGASKSKKRKGRYAAARSKRSKSAGKSRLAQKPAVKLTDVVNPLYLTVLSRFPTAEELQPIREYIAASPSKLEAIVDVVWGLINTEEFLYRH